MKLHVAPARWAEMLRNRDDEEWQTAFDDLVRGFLELIRDNRSWLRVRALGTALNDGELAEELAHEFWIFLVENPGMLAFFSVRDVGAIRHQMIRFLSLKKSPSLEMAEGNLKDWLAGKMHIVLNGKSFARMRGPRSVWGVRGLVERIASSADIDRAKQRQPKLPANWRPRNRAQDPSVVDLENLDRHLRIVFEIVAAYCLFRTLHELCWLALDPPFESMLTDAQPKEPAGEARTDDPDRDPWLNVLLRRLFESLEDETRQIVRITYVEGASVRDIEATAGLSKSTIQRKLEAFRRQLKELLEARGLMAADADLIGRALRDSFLS